MKHCLKALRVELIVVLGCSAIGLLLSGGALAQARPCPPTVTGAGGPNCGIDAEQDWLYRSTLPGVQWAHNFESDDEITRFIWRSGYGDDPGRVTPGAQLVTHDTTDYVSGGGSLKITRAQGSSESGGWYRPFAPLQDSGRGTPDQGWSAGDPTTLSSQGDATRLFNWSGTDAGRYGPDAGDGKREFWLQYRIKLDSRRTDQTVSGGKIQYLTLGDGRVVAQELVTYYKNATNFSIYQGSGYSEIDSELPYTPFATDEWVTHLYHVVAGDEFEDLGDGPGTRLSSITVYQHRSGEDGYTNIWENSGFKVDYQNAYAKALNGLIFNAYHNGIDMDEFTQQYDEVIFSTNFIPPPTN